MKEIKEIVHHLEMATDSITDKTILHNLEMVMDNITAFQNDMQELIKSIIHTIDLFHHSQDSELLRRINEIITQKTERWGLGFEEEK